MIFAAWGAQAPDLLAAIGESTLITVMVVLAIIGLLIYIIRR